MRISVKMTSPPPHSICLQMCVTFKVIVLITAEWADTARCQWDMCERLTNVSQCLECLPQHVRCIPDRLGRRRSPLDATRRPFTLISSAYSVYSQAKNQRLYQRTRAVPGTL